MLQVAGLEEYKQVEVPGAAEVGDDDGVDRHGGEEGVPGGGGDGGEGGVGGGADGLLDVEEFAARDGGVLGGSLEGEPQPHDVPQHAHHAWAVGTQIHKRCQLARSQYHLQVAR